MDLVAAFLARGLSPRSVSVYVAMVRKAEAWCAANGTNLATIGPQALADYVGTLPRTWSSRKGARSALQHYWDVIERAAPPLAVVRVPPKPQMVCRALEDDEARMLAKVAKERHDRKGLMVLLGLYQAMRREEIAVMPWSHILDGGWLRIIGKGDRERRVPLHSVTAAELARIRHPSMAGGWVFPGRRSGTSVTPATVWSWTLEVAEEAGVTGVTPHRLRHTALATANDATGDLRAVQAFAGHSRPETTAGYTRASTRALRAVVEAIDY